MISPVDKSTFIVAVGLAAVITGGALWYRKLFKDSVSVADPIYDEGETVIIDGIPYTVARFDRYFGFFNAQSYKTQWWYYLTEAGETDGMWWPEEVIKAEV